MRRAFSGLRKLHTVEVGTHSILSRNSKANQNSIDSMHCNGQFQELMNKRRRIFFLSSRSQDWMSTFGPTRDSKFPRELTFFCASPPTHCLRSQGQAAAAGRGTAWFTGMMCGICPAIFTQPRPKPASRAHLVTTGNKMKRGPPPRLRRRARTKRFATVERSLFYHQSW